LRAGGGAGRGGVAGEPASDPGRAQQAGADGPAVTSPEDSSRLSSQDRARRVRVTADQPSTTDEAAATSGIALPGAPVHEADTVFLNGLIRAQLRLAAGCLAAFLLVSLALTLMVLLIAR